MGLIYLLLIWLGIISSVFILISLIFRDDIKDTKEKDPAARNSFHIIFLYAGLHALMLHRLAHFLYKRKLLFVARLLSQTSRFMTGIEIHPGAQIGQGFFIDHGMGVVIGETTIIGNHVTLFQGVTLGGTGKETGKRHPTLRDNIVVGAGAKVLGNIEVGSNAYIGANAVVIRDVPPNTTVVGVPGRVTKQEGKKIDTQMDHARILDPVMQQMDDLRARINGLEKKNG